MKKSGFVALIGRPNAGKSTLLNRLIGEKIAIVSDKPQTTRSRILGVRIHDGTQMIFVDTPGIHRPGYRLNERMMETVYQALKDVDLIVHIVDVSEPYGKGESFVLELVKQTKKPTLLALNKVDLVNKGKILPVIQFYSQEHDYRDIVPISATEGVNEEALLEAISENLPESEFLYPPDFLTDQQELAIVAEIIREKVLNNTRQELPYVTAVKLEDFDETRREEGFVRIVASILVEKESQKKIVIGRGGKMIKTIGSQARREIEAFLKVKKIFLDLTVRVVPGWRDREPLLNELGVSGQPR